MIAGQWSKEEDAAILELVDKIPQRPVDWQQVSVKLNECFGRQRSALQCLCRYQVSSFKRKKDFF